MKKVEMLYALDEAKKRHKEQMHSVEKILAGKEVAKPPKVGKVECECGRWLYSDKEQMEFIIGMQLFEKIDKYHDLWHREYKKIYDIYFKEKKGLISKLFSSHKVDPLDEDKAKTYYKDMVVASKEFFHAIDVAHRRVSALSEAKFK